MPDGKPAEGTEEIIATLESVLGAIQNTSARIIITFTPSRHRPALSADCRAPPVSDV